MALWVVAVSLCVSRVGLVAVGRLLCIGCCESITLGWSHCRSTVAGVNRCGLVAAVVGPFVERECVGPLLWCIIDTAGPFFLLTH